MSQNGDRPAPVDPYRPTLALQRQILEENRDRSREIGYRLELELAGLQVQHAKFVFMGSNRPSVAKAARVQELEESYQNAYRAAREYQRLLQELPAEEPAAQDPLVAEV